MRMSLLMMVFAGLVVVAKRYGDLPLGRALHEWLIERPAAWLTGPRLRRILIATVILAAAALVWAEIAPVMASFEYSPLLWFADMTLYADAILMVVVGVAAVRARSVGRFVLAKLSAGLRPVRRPRARPSSPRRPKRPPPANDDAPGWAVRPYQDVTAARACRAA
jgi:hypothetical protein